MLCRLFILVNTSVILFKYYSRHQRSLYNAHITTSKLRESVEAKRTELQCLKQNLKLISILKGQVTLLIFGTSMVVHKESYVLLLSLWLYNNIWWLQMIYLEEFALIDLDFSRSFSGAIEALRASTLRLPVVGGARVWTVLTFTWFWPHWHWEE